MKFGALWIDKQVDTSLPINLGNDIQHFYAVVNLYREIGISDDDIIPVKSSERKKLQGYNNEQIIMVINEALFGVGNDDMSMPFPLPDNITPIFLGLSFLGRTSISGNVIEYLQKFQPIGCRDTFTMELLKRHGIESYTFGCISLTIPYRKLTKNADKYFVVDVSDGLWRYIPNEIRNSSKLIKFSHSFPEELNFPDDAQRRYNLVERTLQTYADDAALVITARLHAVLPCIGMGIPVVYAAENHSKRLAWIDKLLPVYTPSDWDKINWNPVPINISNIKEMMRDTAITAIRDTINKKPQSAGNLRKISGYWEDRPNYQYDNLVQDILEAHFKCIPEGFKYILWGVGLVGESLYQFMRENYPSSEMVLAVDSFITGEFHGVNVERPDEIIKHNDIIILVATYTGRRAVEEWMYKHGKKHGHDYIFFSTSSG